MYVRTLADLPLDIGLVQGWRDSLAAVRANQAEELEFTKTPRDLQVEAVETFASVQETWTRRSIEGSVWSEYPSRIVARWDPGEPKFTPEPGKTYFYENVGTTSSPSVLFDGYQPPPSNQLVVGDAQTMDIIATHMIPEQLRAVVHTSGHVARRQVRLHGRPPRAHRRRHAGPGRRLDDAQARRHHPAARAAGHYRRPVASRSGLQGQGAVRRIRARPGRAGPVPLRPGNGRDPGRRQGRRHGRLHLHSLDRQGLRIHLRADGARRLRPGTQHGHAGRPDDVPGKSVGHAAFLGRHHRSGDLGGRRRVSHPGLPTQLGRHRQRPRSTFTRS